MLKKVKRGTAAHGKKASHERWLITYSDLITLLLIFFVVMYSLSSINARKFKAVAMSLARAMGGERSVLTDTGPSLAPGMSAPSPEQEEQLAKELAENAGLEEIKRELERFIAENGLTGKVSVSLEERGVVLSFQEVALFPLGSADLTPEARETVRKLGPILNKVPNYLRVEGHTDDLPINTARFPSNWELSVARAASVVQEMIGPLGIAPHRLSATGYGEYRPRVPNDSVENRQKNRRVDIVILRSRYETAEPAAVLGAAGR